MLTNGQYCSISASNASNTEGMLDKPFLEKIEVGMTSILGGQLGKT